MSKDEGISLEIETLAFFCGPLDKWDYDMANVLDVRFEDLIANPYKHFLEIFRFLGLLDEWPYPLSKRMAYTLSPLHHLRYRTGRSLGHLPGAVAHRRIPAERLLGIVWENDFEQKAAGRRRGEEDSSSHLRKGIVGDWRNHFSDDHISRFKELYNPLLLKLGYETTPDW